MLKHIAMKFVDQAKHEGFVRFKDGNRINFCHYNLEKISMKTAVNSINGPNVITDWDASLNGDERKIVRNNKEEFMEQVDKFTKYQDWL